MSARVVPIQSASPENPRRTCDLRGKLLFADACLEGASTALALFVEALPAAAISPDMAALWDRACTELAAVDAVIRQALEMARGDGEDCVSR